MRIKMHDFAKLPSVLQERIAAAMRAAEAATGAEILKRRKELVTLQREASLISFDHRNDEREKNGKKPAKLTQAAQKMVDAQRKAQRELLEMTLLQQLQAHKLWDLFEREYRFHPIRRWSLDFYASRYKLGIEIHGGVDIYGGPGGRHTRGRGFIADREKMNTAQIGGISVLEFTAEHLKTGLAIKQIQQFIAERQ
jgi:very-short-patch-repair endonuclease